ncbi:MAG: hypothetical protein IKO46_12975 [Salinivirgaceae bacterium]|nr:hypothetical protein [Salinivirgaceae bacterium]
MLGKIIALLAEARELDAKTYADRTAISAKEFPPYDEDGRYVPKHMYKHEPSADYNRLWQMHLYAHSALMWLESAEKDYKQYLEWLDVCIQKGAQPD